MSEGVCYHAGMFPPEKLEWPRLVPLISPATRNIAKYDGLLHAVPNPEVLLAPLRTKEATSSCRIEGTLVTDEEVFAADAATGKLEVDPVKQREILEAQNYRRALKKAVELMDDPKRPREIYGTILKESHEILLEGQQGGHPGHYRKEPVHIGSRGGPIRFRPIEHNLLEGGMKKWEDYTALSDEQDSLVQLAISHAEFESLHPFCDGNGRMGRILVPLFLYNRDILSSPTFYVSEYLEEHRQEYYDALLRVSSEDDWTGWCVFFLNALKEQGERNVGKAKGILDLYAEKKIWIREEKEIGLKDTTPALDFIFENVEFNSNSFIEKTEIKSATARRFLKSCAEKDLLTCTKEAKGRSPASYSFTELRDLIG